MSVRAWSSAWSSISGRLAAMFALLVLVAFGAVGWAMFDRLASVIGHERAHAQRAKFELVLSMLDRVREGGRVSDHWARIAQEIESLHRTDTGTRFWVFCDEGANTVCSADRPALSALRHTRDWQRVTYAAVGLQPPPIAAGNADAWLLALSADVPGLPPGHRVRLVATRDTTAETLALRRFAWQVAGISLVAALATALLGWALARNALRPVSRLSASAAALGPGQLRRRIELPDPGSELHGLAVALNAALDRIEQAFAQLETFNANVAHELRTPLNSLIGSAQVALSRPRSADELTEVLTGNLEDCERLATMVRDMLFLARADHGQRADSLQTTALHELAQDTAEFFEPLLQERGLTLEVSGQAWAVVNPGLIKRALSNLVANAVQYGEPGEPLRIELVDHSQREGQGGSELIVSNRGPSLSADTLSRMFDRFYRADESRHRSGGHVGLGLAIVRAVAIMHGGTVLARSEGARVQIGLTLP